METQNQNQQLNNNQEPNNSWLSKHMLLGYVFLALIFAGIVGGIYYWQYLAASNQQTVSSKQNKTVEDETTTWRTYRNEEYGFEFRYPEKLRLEKKGSEIVLTHSIPYENNGDCDMSGQERSYPNLTDFNLSFRILPQAPDVKFIDGEYKSANLNGYWIYDGAEGCGDTVYYFPTKKGDNLVARRANIQALNPGVNTWKRDDILKIPSVIMREENERLFDQILSTFKFVE